MKIVVRLGVVFDAENYAVAGVHVEHLVSALEAISGVRARVTGFETRPCEADEFENELYGQPSIEPSPDNIAKLAELVVDTLERRAARTVETAG